MKLEKKMSIMSNFEMNSKDKGVKLTALKLAEKKLKDSEKEFRNIIENTKDGIIIVDLKGKIKFMSKQISTMLGQDMVTI